MLLRHTYREFSLENRVFKGEAWVSGQESSTYAKDYAKENPAVLRDQIKENTKEEWQKLADDFNDGLERLLSKVPNRTSATIEQRFMPVAQTSVEKGVFALLKQQMPTLFPDAESLQMAYKYTMMQTDGKVNILEAGDIISLKNGILNVSKPDGRVMYEAELYPWSLFDGQVSPSKTDGTPNEAAPAEPTPVEPAPAKAPEAVPAPTTTTEPTEEPKTTAPAEPDTASEADTLPTEPTQTPAVTPAAPTETEALSERDAALQKAWEVEKQVLIQTAIDGGVTLDIKDEGPHGNNKDITVLKDGEPVGHIEAQVPPGKISAYNSDNNVNIFTRTAKGRREISKDPEAGLRMILEALNPSTTVEKRSITDKKLARLTEKYEKKFGLGIAEVRVEVDQQLQGISGVEGKIKEYLENKNGDYDILLIKDGGETTVIQVRHGGKEDEGSITLKGSGKTFRDIDEAIGAVRGLAKELAATPITTPSEPGDKPPAAEEKQEKPVETPSFEKGLRIFDLENAKTSEGILLQDAPLGQILGEGVNSHVVGRLGKYPITIYEKTTEGISGDISLEDFYVKVLIKNDGSAQMEIHAQDEFDKAARSYDPQILDSASVSSSADARNFLKDFQDQIGKNQEETAPSPKEKREQKDAEKAEIEALEASLKEPYIEALRRLAEKHPEITKFKVDEQLDRLTPKFSIKKDPENPALCTLTLGFMYRDVWVGAEQTYRYSDLKVEAAAKALALATLGGLEGATPEPK